MNQNISSFTIAAALLSFLCLTKPGLGAEPLILQYTEPATRWMEEALPIGNGHMGAMIFGGAQAEHIQFNEGTLWVGDEFNTGAYQAFGDVFVELADPANPTDAQVLTPADYHRELDLERAVHTVTYEKNGIHYRREAFASYPANVIAYRFTADKPGSLTGAVLLTDMHEAAISAHNATITSVGSLAGYSFDAKQNKKSNRNPYKKTPLNFEAQVRVLHEGGTLKVDGDKIVFTNASTMTILLSAGTDFLQDHTKQWKGELPHAKVTARIEAAASRSWDDLLAEHLRDYQNLFNRVSLDLGSSHATALPTNVRLVNLKETRERDPQLETLHFQYGRYLTIASSRPGGTPATLQGKWNHSNNPPWRCDYHTDVNVQMSYWPTDLANLSECFAPYSDWIQSIRAVRTADTLKTFKKPGWLVKGESGLFGGSTWRWVPGGSAWLLQNSYDHYRFTGDQEYLRTRAYPAMKEVCDYWLASFIVQPDGTLVTPESFSPEYGPMEIGIAFDQQVVWDLFNNTIEASAILGVDEDYRKVLLEKQSHILPPKIGCWGQLQEWIVDRDVPGFNNDNLVHVFGLYPGRQISPLKTPELAEAARVSMEVRGETGTGWGMANRLNVWARLQDGERAYVMVRNSLNLVGDKKFKGQRGGGVYANLLGACPPFIIDSNFGYTAGVCEMLLQSQVDEIHLLPALPKAWANGSVKGLRARGGFIVDIEWKDSKVTGYRITSTEPKEVKVRMDGVLKNIRSAGRL